MTELQTIKATQDTSASVEPKQEETRGETQIQRREPIMQFESQEQLDASLKEWQERLGLRDWAIKARLCNVLQNSASTGFCEANYISKTAQIYILKEPNENSGTEYIKFCTEQTLVHELLHCVMYGSTFTDKNPTVDWVFYEMRTHQELETLSRAFICAKYNITLDWFRA